MSWATTDNTLSANESPVTLLLAAPEQGRVDAWYNLLASDARFRVVATATSSADLNAKLAMTPEVILMDGMLFRSASELAHVLTRYNGVAWVLLPTQSTDADVAAVSGLPCVKRVFKGDFNLAQETGRLYETVRALRLPTGATTNVWNPLDNPSSQIPTGLRVIAVWNLVGGAGKTTLAVNLAFEARRRGLKTLLVGLGAPDDMALTLPRTKATPNLTAWNANPTPDGLRASLQTAEGLDVLAGWPDVLSATQSHLTELDAPNSLRNLVVTAAYAGYAVIVLDTPAVERAAPALSAANQLLLVARPTLSDALRSVEAYRMVTENLSHQHRIPAQGIRLALNQTREGLWSPAQFHNACAQLLNPDQKKPFPPIVAAIPDDARVPEAQIRREVPLLSAPNFQRAFMLLAEACLQIKGNPSPVTANDDGPRKTINLGLVKVKM